MLSNEVLGKTFGPNSEEVMTDWRKLHSEEVHGLYFSTNIIRVVKSRKVRIIEARGTGGGGGKLIQGFGKGAEGKIHVETARKYIGG